MPYTSRNPYLNYTLQPKMLVTALCHFTSVLRTLAADRDLVTMLSQEVLQGILFKCTNNSNIYNK